MRKLVLLSAVAMTVAASWTNVASPAVPKRTDAYPLHVGSTPAKTSRGPRVSNLQWLLGGHKPSVFRGIRPMAGIAPSGFYGARTAKAVKVAKFKLGYPTYAITGRVDTPMLKAYLTGTKTRPRTYVARAAARARAARLATAQTTMQKRIVATAKRYIGVAESPLGSNSGYQVRIFQSATGAYGAAWCASFVQYVLKTAGYGTVANRSAHVYTIKSYGVARGWARSQKPVPGRLVVFNSWQGHIGLVSLVTAGGFWSIEGNSSNRVVSRFHPWGARSVTFLRLPNLP